MDQGHERDLCVGQSHLQRHTSWSLLYPICDWCTLKLWLQALILVCIAAQPVVRAQGQAGDSNRLALWSDTPRWVRSTAPLADERGLALPQPVAGPAGHALYLTDTQVSWRLSVGCRVCGTW